MLRSMPTGWMGPRRVTLPGWRSGRRFAPNFKHRRRILPNPAHQAASKPHASRPALGGWMQRLKRIFHVGIVRVAPSGRGYGSPAESEMESIERFIPAS